MSLANVKRKEHYDLIGAENPKLDHTDFRDLSRREREPCIHDGETPIKGNGTLEIGYQIDLKMFLVFPSLFEFV